MGQRTTAANPETPASRGKVDATKKFWWAGAVAVPVLVAVIGVLPSFLGGGSSGDTYISNSQVGDLTFTTNVEITDPAARSRFDQAIAFAREGLFAEAKALLEQIAPTVQAAGVYNNLAVVNAALGDDVAAQRSVQQALQIDPVNQTAQQNFTLISRAIKEQRSNATILTASRIQLGRSVASRLGDGDSDFFSFTTPAGSRDILRVQVENKSTTLAPSIKLFDSARSEIAYTYQATLGANLMLEFVAVPGAVYYVQVAAISTGQMGAYAVSVAPQQAFDRFEPNDEILKAAEIKAGRDVDAGIMDPQDQDLYRVAVSAGPVRVALSNRSSDLAPSIAVYDENKSQVAFGYDPTAGADLSVEGAAIRAGTWYVRVGSSSGAGQYTLKVAQ